MKGKRCEDKECSKRHRHICKYWDSQTGCSRKSKCSYLHEDPKENVEKTEEKKVRNECYACHFDDYENNQVNLHKIKNLNFLLCLNCDASIKRKEILLSTKFCMREVLREEFPGISSKELDRMVRK